MLEQRENETYEQSYKRYICERIIALAKLINKKVNGKTIYFVPKDRIREEFENERGNG